MKHKKIKMTALFISAIACLCACTPAIDNGLTRSPLEHLTIPDAVPTNENAGQAASDENENISGKTTANENPSDGSMSDSTGTDSNPQGLAQDSFDSTSQPGVTGFSEDILTKANTLLTSMTLEEKVGQMFLARCPETDGANQAAAYHLGGYVLFGRDFENKTEEQVISDIQSYQSSSAIPMFIAVDEEGGTVIRVSSNSQLRPYPFWSPQELFAEGGFELVSSDAEDKSVLLKHLGINLNLAPVCDVSTNASDYMYQRSFGQPAAETAEYVTTVVGAMNRQGMGSTLKHFPGYGNNVDTHEGIARDSRSYETFTESDFLPFQAGINENATSVLVSHNIVECMDSEKPASLSPAVHDILRNDLGFDGIIMTDDLSMEAILQYTDGQNAAVLAVLAGNDMICCTDFTTQIPAVIDAVNTGVISETRIDQAVLRILASKIELGIIQ